MGNSERHDIIRNGVREKRNQWGQTPLIHFLRLDPRRSLSPRRWTISQPCIVALMTDLLNPEPEHVGLEVGTGSGYQAASILKEHEAGAPVSELSRCHGVAENTTYRWKWQKTGSGPNHFVVTLENIRIPKSDDKQHQA